MARLSRDDLDVLRAEPQRAATAVHRRVADADDQHALADGVDVPERDRAEPIDADVNAIAHVAAGQHQVLALRRATADEHGAKTLVEQRSHARHGRIRLDLYAEPRDITDLFVEHFGRQAKRRYVRAHEPAGSIHGFEDHAVVAERCQVVGDGERCAAGSDQRDAPAVLALRWRRQAALDVAAIIRRDTLQAADRDGLLLDAPAPASGLAGPVAHAAQDSGKNIRLPIK